MRQQSEFINRTEPNSRAPIICIRTSLVAASLALTTAIPASAEHAFSFVVTEQGEAYIRINSIPLRFTRTGETPMRGGNRTGCDEQELNGSSNKPVI